MSCEMYRLYVTNLLKRTPQYQRQSTKTTFYFFQGFNKKKQVTIIVVHTFIFQIHVSKSYKIQEKLGYSDIT